MKGLKKNLRACLRKTLKAKNRGNYAERVAVIRAGSKRRMGLFSCETKKRKKKKAQTGGNTGRNYKIHPRNETRLQSWDARRRYLEHLARGNKTGF